MYLLYLDESGTHSSARHFVLAGVSVYETNIRWATDRLNRIQSKVFPDVDENVLFHASPLRAREGEKAAPPFDRLDRNARLEILSQLQDAPTGMSLRKTSPAHAPQTGAKDAETGG